MRIALIGSGISAIGAMQSLQGRSCISIDHYIGNGRDILANYSYSNGQPASSLGVGGLSSYWHGVIPISHYHRSIANYELLFTQFYPKSIADGYDLFIPLRPLRGWPHVKKFEKRNCGQYKKIPYLVSSIQSTGTVQKINSPAGCHHYDLVILAVGDLEALELLNIEMSSIPLYDHVNGYLGTTKAADFRSKLGTHQSLRGHSRSVYKETSDCIFLSRPAIGKRAEVFALEQVNYGLTASHLMPVLLKKFSLNKFNEAFYNRFGFRLISENKVSMHFQKTVEVHLNGKDKKLSLNFDKKMFEKIGKDLDLKNEVSDFTGCKFNFYPGTHIRAHVKGKHKFEGTIITGFLDQKDVLSPFHHSFTKLVTMFNRVETFFEDK